MTTAYLTHPRFIEHDLPQHPEHAGRIQAIWEQLGAQSLAEQLLRIQPSPASSDQILAAHSPTQLERLMNISHQGRMVRIDADTYALPVSPEIARLAAGAAVSAVDLIAEKRADNALALVRPPGHHATKDWQMGFCLLNNIAIAARHAQAQHQYEKVLIIDYDVHHGNGTQDIFYADPSVLFISIHQSPLYPGGGTFDETGAGAGCGSTINLPLPSGHGDASYRRAFQEVVRPAAERFAPQLLLVSLGFDAHWVDPLAGMALSLAGYDQLARECLRMAKELCGGRIVFVMEGGYDLQALAHGWCNIVRALTGVEGLSDPYGASPAAGEASDIAPILARARQIHGL